MDRHPSTSAKPKDLITAAPFRSTRLRPPTTFRSFRDLRRPARSSCTWALWSVHMPPGGAAFNGSTINYSNASNSRKTDSPELRPLPPLNTQQGFRQNFRTNADVVSSKDDESEEFYSPKGSINGKESSIGTGSASRRAFASIEVENFNESISDSSSTYSSSVPGSGSGSPVRSGSLSLSPPNNISPRNSMPKSPDLIEIQTIAPWAAETRGLLFQESASPSPPSSSSPERYSRRSEESSPRISNASDHIVESPVRISSPVQHNTTPTETRGLFFPESVSALPPRTSSPDRYSSRSDESSPRTSNVLDQNVTDYTNVIPTPPEIQGLVFLESASALPPRISNLSDQNVESPERISSPVQHNTTFTPTPPEIQSLVFLESPSQLPPSFPERYSRRSESSSPRISNVSDQIIESPVRIGSPLQHNTISIATPPEMQALVFQESASSPERYSMRIEESSPRNSNLESPVRISSPAQNSATVAPTSPEMQGLVFPNYASPLPQISSSPVRYSSSEESSPRISNVSDQNVEYMFKSGSSVQHKSPMNLSSPERYLTSEESSPRTSNASDDQNLESPIRISSHLQHNATVIPTAPPPPPSILSVPTPPPPPPPPSKVWESPRTPTPPPKKPIVPPALINPLRPIVLESPTSISPMELPSNDFEMVRNKETEYSSEDVEQNGDSTSKPKLKPLHWDKVRASSDREMVWDQFKCSSFKLNEEMIETLFVVNTPKPNPKETTRWQVLPSPGQDNGDRVLDPKKAQNIAILLKALHVTVDEVCEGLLEGNADILGTELLESLMKMAPTKEEERKLKEYKDDSPIKLGAAERFLKAVVDIPYAFKRVDAMLYISNFESEIEYLKKSFATLEAACEELRTSKMFLKLLEAVLKTGNRMNVGTNRGDAHAFKLDTLLKLVDVKGADGKTTLLHFVVQEILRSEGARLSSGTPHENSCINDDAKCRKLGLQVVSALSSELSNVKKAAVMDAEVLTSEVSKLSKGIENVREIVTLIETLPLQENISNKFSDTMNNFMKRAEEEIFRIQAQESVALSLVKEITEYFHGNSAKEEAHPFRIFMVVRDFLTILDRVCKEVGMINERTIVSSAHKFPVPVNPMLQQVSGTFHKRQCNSSDDESLPLNA
ncbi:hypothetical protein DH2020_021997 [Rehmannia glutinosa]|uniref:Formin-like protein n=1 Tax=Rehmannia glutinosa TaxID=99300 RepID=A0ABR0WCL0_REHGL